MKDGYMREKDRLGKLAGAAAAVAREFEQTQDRQAAVAAQVLFAMILAQLETVDDELGRLLEEAGI
jgi:hypothetical protein